MGAEITSIMSKVYLTTILRTTTVYPKLIFLESLRFDQKRENVAIEFCFYVNIVRYAGSFVAVVRISTHHLAQKCGKRLSRKTTKIQPTFTRLIFQMDKIDNV
uniref:Uncharacterized protein n=1 Tax=Romanomermis culicivorax TaxID=13658 RepID=A0A915IEA0_ROMCU